MKCSICHSTEGRGSQRCFLETGHLVESTSLIWEGAQPRLFQHRVRDFSRRRLPHARSTPDKGSLHLPTPVCSMSYSMLPWKQHREKEVRTSVLWLESAGCGESPHPHDFISRDSQMWWVKVPAPWPKPCQGPSAGDICTGFIRGTLMCSRVILFLFFLWICSFLIPASFGNLMAIAHFLVFEIGLREN